MELAEVPVPKVTVVCPCASCTRSVIVTERIMVDSFLIILFGLINKTSSKIDQQSLHLSGEN